MKFFKKILMIFGMVVMTSMTINMVTPAEVSAASKNGCGTLLGLNSWYCGLDNNNDGEIDPIEDEDTLQEAIWTIASNVLVDIGVIAAYLVLGYVIYGGYQYMFSDGDVSKVMAGKKTLTRAFIGYGMVMGANVILNTVRIAVFGANGKFDGLGCVTGSGTCIDANTMVTTAIQWIVGVSGVVALIFIVIGGVKYMTSAGDAGRLAKAKSTILYASIGLIIVILAEVITGFVSGILNNAGVDGVSYLGTDASEVMVEARERMIGAGDNVEARGSAINYNIIKEVDEENS